MPFDQPTRNRLARFVADARTLLTEEFTRQLQNDYGLDPGRGEVTPLERLGHLDDARRETAAILRETLAHYLAGETKPSAKSRQEALARIVREQAFTVLNRLCALRMAEARELLVESISRGYQSRGFRMYASLAGSALGETGDAYRIYLFSLFDEFAVDLAVLFDRYSPQGRLFPREAVLMQLLDLINHFEIAPLWAEDETIGWIYQYFNSKEERKAMRDASQAPRNSRELAVRNQFFTPRYVVEFLTDNTLGRIWYEMTRGETRLAEQCRYLVRRPAEVFLDDPDAYLRSECRPWVRKVRSGDFSELPDDPHDEELASVSLAFNGYDLFDERRGDRDFDAWTHERFDAYAKDGTLPASSLDLWIMLFVFQRRWRSITGSGPAPDEFMQEWRQVYLAWKKAIQAAPDDLSQEELLKQPVYIPYRPLKDPRTLLMLDPACGSMHFGLYAFDLYEVIYEEAWARGLIAPEEFGYRDKPRLLQDSVRLNPQHMPVSNYSNERVPFDDAFVVVADGGDYADGVGEGRLYVISASTRFRVPFRYRVKLSEFDYQAALREGVFDEETGEWFVRSCSCFDFAEEPAVSHEEAHANFVRQIPRLIVEYNIHGIDIDPRAVQIAGLSLWLRAQRSWRDQGVRAADRPVIRKSNIVCAEPMPGDKAQLDEFLKNLRDERLESLIRRVLDVPDGQRVRATPAMADALCELVNTVWQEMELAGEAGSLLKIEESLAAAIAHARDEWETRLPLFRVETFRMTGEKPQVNYLRRVPGEEADFWERAEALVLAALQEYAEQAQQGTGTARRLFAHDAARGFAFIDLCRKRYDVVLMNPPFGDLSAGFFDYGATEYPTTKYDLATIFIERICGLSDSNGRCGWITSRTWMALSLLESFRSDVLYRDGRLDLVADFGIGVLDALVETAACVLGIAGSSNSVVSVFRLLDSKDKEADFDAMLARGVSSAISRALADIQKIPRRAFGYWLPTSFVETLSHLPNLEESGGAARQGLATTDDFRFLRAIWEIPSEQNGWGLRWVPLAKGGEYEPYYDDIHLVIDYSDDGQVLK